MDFVVIAKTEAKNLGLLEMFADELVPALETAASRSFRRSRGRKPNQAPKGAK